ncbi:MAG: OprD family outer membrane porin [Campylobacterales bacterium]|nr:OprD family outer membrane porin [Campylobacterales bacterium]
MKKNIAISVITVGLLSSVSVFGAEDLSTMFSEGKTSGQLREFSISRTMDYSDVSKKDYTRSANAIGGYLKYETAAYSGLSFGTALYTTNGFSLGENKATNVEVDPTLLGKNNDGYSILGEAYVQYKLANTTFKGGRQKLDTPLAGSDDARMLPNLFEAYLLINTDIKDTTLIAGQVTKFAQGTFGRTYASGILSATAGYSAVDAKNQVGDFVNMGNYAIGKTTDGVSVASATYTGIKNLKVQAWDYYAHDILNAFYADADFSWTCLLNENVKPFVAAQIIKENDVGDKLVGNVKGMYWGAKLGAKVENFIAYAAYSQTSENSSTSAATENAIITPWGGMPAYTQGMVTRHQFLAGTKASKVSASYNWKTFGPDLSTELYYANFDMASFNGYTYGNARESGFDVIYKPASVKNLALRLRANYADDFNVAKTTLATTSWDEYRVIVNYNF